jgi:hypothetical protein
MAHTLVRGIPATGCHVSEDRPFVISELQIVRPGDGVRAKRTQPPLRQ